MPSWPKCLATLVLGTAAWALLATGVLMAGESGASEASGKLRLGTCQFPISADIAKNADWIRRQIRQAKQQEADVAHFPEAALSGYAEADHDSLDNLDWKLLRRETESIMALAKQCRVWVVLGSTHRLTGENKPHNSLYVISPEGRIVDRYDKRFCTDGDFKHYTSGNHCTVFEVHGVRCGLLICHDYRYPELYREYTKRNVHLILHSFYNVGKTDEAMRQKMAAQYAQVYATMNHFFISYTNTSRRWSWPGFFVTPDGKVAAQMPQNKAAVTVNEVDLSRKYRDASVSFRADAIRGKLHSGKTVDDPRSADRTSF